MRDKSEGEAWERYLAEVLGFYYGAYRNHGGFAGAEPCLRQGRMPGEGASLGLSRLFKFDKSWTVHRYPLDFSVPMLPPPTPEQTPLGLALPFWEEAPLGLRGLFQGWRK